MGLLDGKVSKKRLLKEIKNCAKDPIYFLKNYAMIVHPDRGIIPFDTYGFQDDVVEALRDHRFNVIVKSRQMGISTIVAGYVLWFAMFRPAKTVIIISTKEKTSINLLDKCKLMYEYLPQWIKIREVTKKNNTTFGFDNKSKIKALSSNPDSARSEAASFIVIDEAAIIDNADEVFEAAYPTIATGGNCIALSTPKGAQGWFFDIYMGAVAEENRFNPIELPWHLHPERDQEWFESETKNMTEKQIAQEYECNFNMSGDTVIPSGHISRLKEFAKGLPYERRHYDKNLHVWNDPVAGEEYLITADVARGDGEDFSTMCVFKTDNFEQVCEYKGKISTEQFTYLLYSMGLKYNNALIAVEANTLGYAVNKDLQDMGYMNIYWQDKQTRRFVPEHIAKNKSGCAIGFQTSVKTRPIIIDKFIEYVTNGKVILKSKRIADEMMSFIWNNGKPQAAKGKNDDLVICAAIACYIYDNKYFRNSDFKKDVEKLSRAIYVSKKDLGRKTNAIDHFYKNTRPSKDIGNPYKKFKWLL